VNTSIKQFGRLFPLVVGMLLYSLAIAPVRASEPSYEGKPLSDWLLALEFHRAGHDNLVSADMRQPEAAIRQMGTNAIPTLLDILGTKEHKKWWTLIMLDSSSFRNYYNDPNVPANDLEAVAVDGFAILGTNGVSAIPQIEKLFRDPDTREQATWALSVLGPAGFKVLAKATMDPDQSVRNTVIWILGHGGGVNNEAITRLLIIALKDPYAINRDDAATFLSGRDPVLAIPALIQTLKDYSDFPTVSGVAKGLGSYGPAAKAAAPLLFSIYTNQVATSDTKSARDWGVELMWGLRAIDLETARKAGEFLINNVPLNYARNEYSVTKLPNGKELIAGGYIDTDILPLGDSDLSSAELLDPATGKWTETGKMKIARHGHSAVLQSDGEVLISGGNHETLVVERFRNFNENKWMTNYTENSRPVSSDELYDPATGMWNLLTNK
jgi:hypothetical protein